MFAPLLKTGTVRKVSLRLVSLRSVISPRPKDPDLFSNFNDFFSPPKVGPKKNPPAKMRGAKTDHSWKARGENDSPEDLLSHLNDPFLPRETSQKDVSLEKIYHIP